MVLLIFFLKSFFIKQRKIIQKTNKKVNTIGKINLIK